MFARIKKRLEENVRANPEDHSRVRGEQLSEPIHYSGRQWAVTSYGVEARDGTYVIESSRLWEEDAEYGWIMHMAKKEWVDLEDFIVVLSLARIKFRNLHPLSKTGKERT
jgi:hypothetical protein